MSYDQMTENYVSTDFARLRIDVPFLKEMADIQQISVAEEALKREFQLEVLNRLRQYLCDHLEPERFFPYLQQRNYLDNESCDQIRNAGTTKSKVNKMVEILMRSGRRPLFALAKSIEKSSPTQKFVAKRLREEHEIWIQRTENISRLESVRQMQHELPTAQYGNTYEQPPPYQPYSRYQQSMSPSHFSLPGSVEPPKTHPKSFESPPIPFVPVSYDRVPSSISRSRSPGNSSYISSSIIDASHFRTIDLEPGSHPHDTSIGDQVTAERKIPPPPGGVEAPSLDDTIFRSQQKELRRYEFKTPNSTPTNWPRSPRTPSEHEVPSNGRVPINGADTENICTETDTSTTENQEARMRTLRFQLSCQSQSFQPSSFNYSSEIDARPDTSDSVARDSQRRSATGSPRNYLSTRDYSSPLETIRSGEVLDELLTSLPANNGSQYIRNPTEHTDPSMMSQNNMDDIEGEIPLEISAASMPNGGPAL